MTQDTTPVNGKPSIDTTMSENIGELVAALAQAQSEITPASKSSDNPFFKSKYADLAEVWAAIRGPLSKNKLAVIQTLSGTDSQPVIVTTLAHASGQWIRGYLALKPTKIDPQGVGSAITYGRRYSLAAICGVVQDDDDGNAASSKVPQVIQSDLPTKPQVATKPSATLDPLQFCTFGKNKGVSWKNMTLESLDFYKSYFEKTINDPTKDKFKSDSEKYLNVICNEIASKSTSQDIAY